MARSSLKASGGASERRDPANGEGEESGDREDGLAALLEGVGEGVLLTDLAGRVRRVNAAAEVLVGKPATHFLGLAWEEALGCGREEEQEPAALPGRRWSESQRRGARGDGKPVSLRLRTRYLYDRAGRPAGRIVLFRESSVHEGLEKKLFAYQRLASLGEMATSLVHEVGNPVSVILGFARLLVQQRGEDPEGEIRDRIYQEANRCRRIVEQLLAYARSSSGSPRPTPLSLKQVVDETLDLLGYQLRRRGVDSRATWDRDLPMVLADAGEMKQVFLNLLLNALDAMEAGGSIWIRGRRTMRRETVGGDSLLQPRTGVVDIPWVEVSVEDEGPGLGTGDPERLFAPFVTTKPKGGGLGLSVSRRLLRERGGTLRLENREGGGARAVVELPAYVPGDSP